MSCGGRPKPWISSSSWTAAAVAALPPVVMPVMTVLWSPYFNAAPVKCWRCIPRRRGLHMHSVRPEVPGTQGMVPHEQRAGWMTAIRAQRTARPATARPTAATRPFAAEGSQRAFAPVCNKVLRIASTRAERRSIWNICSVPDALNTLQHRCRTAYAALSACHLNICRNSHRI